MNVNTLAQSSPPLKANQSKSNHHPEPEITLCEAESDYKGDGSELR